MDKAQNNIRDLRTRLGLSLQQVAEAVDVTPSQIQKLEAGKIKLSQDWMRRLAPVFNCAPAELLADDDLPYRLDPEELRLINELRRCNQPGRSRVLRVALAAIDDDAVRAIA